MRIRKPKDQRRPWFELGKKLGVPDCPYLIRWMIDFRLFSIRVHHFIGSDDRRALHDHPWFFITVILRGWYDDVGEHSTKRMKAGKIAYRPAKHRHTVQVGKEGCWTIIFTGRKIRHWGFWKDGKKFVKANKWFLSMGHHKPNHPCD